MKYKKGLALLFCLPLVILSLSGCAATSTTGKQRIAVIVKSTTSDFWHNVQSGVNAAATEYNQEVSFAGPENEEAYADQNDMIDQAVASGVGAIVLSAIDYQKNTAAVERACDAGVRVVMIDSGVDSNRVDAFIGTDNYQSGIQIAETALTLPTGGKKLRIGLVNYDKHSANGQQRERGFRDVIATHQTAAEIVDVVNVLSSTASATTGAITLLRQHPDINLIVGFNEWTTIGVGNAIQQLGLSDTVAAIGFDSNVHSIAMLETGEMDALLVQNPFAIGYLGVQCACRLLASEKVEESIPTTTTVVTKSNMYDDAVQKALFPFR